MLAIYASQETTLFSQTFNNKLLISQVTMIICMIRYIVNKLFGIYPEYSYQ